MELSRVRGLIIAALLLSVLCLMLAPMLMSGGYSIVEHTTSEAAAQATEGAWLARTGFLLFGLAIFSLGVANRRWPPSARVLHATFGLMMIASAVYSHRPFVDGAEYDQTEDMLHSVAATGMGFAFAFGVLIVGWRRIPRWRLTDALALLASVGVPLSMSVWQEQAGLLQRGMFLVAFLWYGLELTDSRRRTAFDTLD